MLTLLRRTIQVLVIGLTLVYPLAAYYGLTVMSPRGLGLVLLGLILLRHGQSVARLAAGISGVEWLSFASLVSLAAAIALFNSETLLRLYPALVSLTLLAVFTRSLRHPPAVVERIARLSEPDLDEAGVRYTRQVTQVWCGFFVVNGGISLVSVFASREYWALYNGLIAYLLMGLLFAGEWLVRGRIRRRTPESAS